MELPKNGGIVIIDDKIAEAVPLMNALAKRGVAYSYFDGKPKNYPKYPLDCVRFVFLDMHLDEAAGATNGNKNIVSSLIAGLDAVVGEKNGPYVIMLWSKHDSQHLQEFKEAVIDNNGLQCKPVAILNMEKTNCFEIIDNMDENGKRGEVEWKLKDNGLEIIENILENQIRAIDSFVLLYNWENGIRNSAKETIRTMGKIFDDDSQTWNENLKASFVRMAKAYAGKMLELTNEKIIQNAYYSMNDIVNDFNCVEVNQNVDVFGYDINVLQTKVDIKGHVIIAEVYDQKEYILSYDTNTYYLYEEGKLVCQKGNIEKLLNSNNDEYEKVKKKLYDTYMNSVCNINSLLNIRNYVLDQKRPGNIYAASEDIKKELCTMHKIDMLWENKIKGIELEISPLCDYAQDKRTRFRILPGLEIPYDLNINKHNNSKHTFISIPMMIDGERKQLLFDFRYYTSEKLDYLDGKKPLYAIGDGLLQTIKEELSTHGVRSGIVYLE